MKANQIGMSECIEWSSKVMTNVVIVTSLDTK